MAALAGSGIGIQLQSAFGKSLPQRCFDVESLLKTTSTKELRNLFKPLVENIFGFETEPGWRLDMVHKSNSVEFKALLQLLGPEGAMFNLINSLQADPYLWYPFPVSALPAPTRRLLDEGAVPTFFSTRLQQQNMGTPVLALSALEFYLCHFAYALVRPGRGPGESMIWSQLLDNLYPHLALDYLLFFLPFSRRKPEPGFPSQQPSRSPVSPTRPFLRQRYSSGSPPYGGSGQRFYSSPVFSPSRPSLLRSSLTATQKVPTPSASPVLEHPETETWRAETVLQIFVEFWLNQNSLDMERQCFSHSENFMPTLNHVKIVRLLVKYLHYFSNSATVVITAPFQSVAQSPLDEFKRTAAPLLVQKKLYAFLRHAFDHWPLDHSFRMVLETWLSYLQPWRYTDPSNLLNPQPVSHSEESRGMEEKWEAFLQDNLLFYTVLLQEFIPRIHRMDLTSPYSAYMVYRVCKVFNTKHLADFLAKAEEELFVGAQGLPARLSLTAELGGSYLGPDHLPHAYVLPPYLAELETPTFHYRPLFSERMLPVICEVIYCVSRSLEQLSKPSPDTRPAPRGFLGWLASLFSEVRDFGTLTPADRTKLTNQLHIIARNLCNIFRFEVPDWVELASQDITQANLTQSLLQEEEELLPDSVYSQDGPVLTDRGRFQIITRQRRFDIQYQGDPDIQPIRSFEVTWMVRTLYAFCNFINTQHAEEIRRLYEREGQVGKMARVVLAPPLPPSRHLSSPLYPHRSQPLQQPRLSLRFLASYRSMAVLGLLFLLLHLWLGLGPVGFLFLVPLGFLLWVFILAQFKRDPRTLDTPDR